MCRVVRALIIWLDVAKGDLVKDPIFQQTLGKIQDQLAQDNLLTELKELSAKLTESMKQRPGAVLSEAAKTSISSIFPVCN